MADYAPNKKIILFDGVCNLCNNTVLTIIKHDKKNTFLFSSLQSEAGKKITQQLGIDTQKTDSIILFEPTDSYTIKADAALKIMISFGGLWNLVKIAWLLPKKLRNIVYDFIAKNRYKWFGKKDSCMIPTPELNSKFLN